MGGGKGGRGVVPPPSPTQTRLPKNKKKNQPHTTTTKGRGRSCAVPTILQSSRASLWVLGAPSVLPLSRPSQSLPCSDVLPIWKIEPVDLGRFLRPFGAELIHTHPPSKSCCLHRGGWRGGGDGGKDFPPRQIRVPPPQAAAAATATATARR